MTLNTGGLGNPPYRGVKGEEYKRYLLLEFIFSEAVPQSCRIDSEAAQRAASSRLLAWAQAFEEWIGEKQIRDAPSLRSGAGSSRRAGNSKKKRNQKKLAWRRLLGSCEGSPWELRAEHLQAHVARMEAQGYAASTITSELRSIRNFYQYCDERRIDPLCGSGFNPVAGVKLPAVRCFATACLWSQAEIDRLLEFTRRDESALGKREYAFFLTRLRVGVATRVMRSLQWGQLRQGDEIQVCWSSLDATGTGYSEICGITSGWGWTRFPGEAWAAISDYLEVSGRLAGMQAGDYIFAPLVLPGAKSDKTRASDWVAGRPITAKTARKNIKIYGRALGIPERLLNLEAMRSTAIRLQLDAEKSIDQMPVFLDSQADAMRTRFKLKYLPPLPHGPGPGAGEIAEIPLPNRKAVQYQPGDGLLHGYYLDSQPPEGVLAVIAQGITGVEDEMAGLRLLARGLVERQMAGERKHTPQLADAHSRAASRVSEMIRLEEQDGGENQWVEELLDSFDLAMEDQGGEPIGDLVRTEAAGFDGLGITSRNLAEEIAGTRYMLRNVLALAVKTQPVPDYVHLVDIYGSGCVRLVKLLKTEQRGQDRLSRYVTKLIDEAREQVLDEDGWRL